ncbi:Uncharacterised protein [Achromobacter xylosoxidans]|nr:Uncharacterised protein [Achromobacter xylosoxidans]
MLRVVRSNRRRPSTSSRSWISAVKDGCVTPSWLAAWVNEPVSTANRKALSGRYLIFIAMD